MTSRFALHYFYIHCVAGSFHYTILYLNNNLHLTDIKGVKNSVIGTLQITKTILEYEYQFNRTVSLKERKNLYSASTASVS